MFPELASLARKTAIKNHKVLKTSPKMAKAKSWIQEEDGKGIK